MDTRKYLQDNYILARTYTGETEIADVTRRDLALLLHKLDFKTGVEVGVAAGQYSEVLASANPQMKLYSIDPWEPYHSYKDYVRQSTFKTMEETAREKLAVYPNCEIIKAYSMDALKQFKDESLDFVYIDANHREEFVTQDITGWIKKVRKGGIISGHDYARIRAKNGEDSSNWAVIQAVTKYAKKNDIEIFVWGLNAKIPKLVRDPIRSWMFIKP